jgi:hypothetical protein
MVCPIIGLDIEPEGIDPCLLQCIEVLRGEAVTICLNQYPEICLCLNETGTLNIILWTTGQISASKCHNITSRPPSLRTQKNIFLLDNLRTERRPLSLHYTGPTTATGIMGMKCGGIAPRFSKGDLPLILLTRLQHISGWPPISLGDLCKVPRVTFSAGEVTTRLVDGEVVFRTREMNGRD